MNALHTDQTVVLNANESDLIDLPRLLPIAQGRPDVNFEVRVHSEP
jgi:hypothetical protein